ncbi:MAG: hypothetical protein UT40_C0025G0012 [Candidatus Woesebacteria bacterium GW2011_GWA1_39_21b]|uniref:Uncharacterized protein n=2 Tax=Patescibacteria group TaxID=1783273 RepID=A0A1G2QE79_9BACT|nr:MAG: hypothetical protein US72_C0021G0011 [Microgenomates group bacterium GW2011_GWC1_38_12]KKR13097.1 MAG: hypothetical protein UT40_C0025G0012 [Candidatus Woesebacteria bacterium GW2011_GWA1_39_21b]OHA58723.1 MAG: hypothetical protein A2370_02465 [Candidatus Vogelbacteria bacterium RIFOXYB1_FULL_42_16]
MNSDWFKKIKISWSGFFDRDRSGYCFRPWHDWRIMIMVFLVLEIVIIFSHYFFYQWLIITKDQISSADLNIVTDIAEQRDLEKTFNSLQQALNLFEETKTAKPELADPSL